MTLSALVLRCPKCCECPAAQPISTASRGRMGFPRRSKRLGDSVDLLDFYLRSSLRVVLGWVENVENSKMFFLLIFFWGNDLIYIYIYISIFYIIFVSIFIFIFIFILFFGSSKHWGVPVLVQSWVKFDWPLEQKNISRTACGALPFRMGGTSQQQRLHDNKKQTHIHTNMCTYMQYN